MLAETWQLRLVEAEVEVVEVEAGVAEEVAEEVAAAHRLQHRDLHRKNKGVLFERTPTDYFIYKRATRT
jgi:hypothetical protein